MLGDILCVEQLEAARDQPRHQMHQRNLGCVAGAMKHALAKKGAAETDAIKAADEVAVQPDLDRVAVAERVQPAIEIADALVDPGVLPAFLRCGTTRYDGLESGIDRDAEASERTVRASREEMRKPSSGITPRFSGSTQNSVGSSALSAIGKMPQA